MVQHRAAHIVLIDDDRDGLALLTALLERERTFTTEAYDVSADGLRRVLEDPPDLVICDLSMPEPDGFEVTARLREAYPTLPILVLTGSTREESADRAYEAGATDFVQKPVGPALLLPRVRRALDEVPARQLLLERERQAFDPHGLVGRHPRLDEVRAFVRAVADVPRAAALILGESGTGKNLVARAIHASSDASRFRFVEVNCAALPDHLLEAELFGYERGAFTDARQSKRGLVEEAHEGTLFLDEIGEMPLDLQAKLLTFLESQRFRRLGSTKEVEVELRVIAATNADIEREVREGRFREDLFFRLDVARTTLPPLREIPEDIPALARHFLEKAAAYFRKPLPEVRPGALAVLERHDWPGNARELRNVMERALIFSRSGVLEVPHPGSPNGAQRADVPSSDGVVLPRGLTLEEVERRYIQATMDQYDGSVNEAADALGVTRKVLWSRRKKYGLLDEAGGGD